MGVYKLNPEEMLSNLQEQRQFLRNACAVFDGGFVLEAKHLATIVHTIIHDGSKNNRSLLTQLNLRDGLAFVGSNIEIPRKSPNLLTDSSLAFMSIPGGRASFFPKAYSDDPHRNTAREKFSKWYDTKILRERRRNGTARTMSRKNLIHHLRSQDGGAHSDVELDEFYAQLSRGEQFGWECENEAGDMVPIPNILFATMRHIAWEVEQTLSVIPGGPEVPPGGVEGPTVAAIRYKDQQGTAPPPIEVPVEHRMGVKISKTNIRIPIEIQYAPPASPSS